MELRLLRAQFPYSMMGQLYMNNQLLCIYIGRNNQKGWTPIAGLPDGSYCLHKQEEENKEGRIQVTSAQSSKSLRMKINDLTQKALIADSDLQLIVNTSASIAANRLLVAWQSHFRIPVSMPINSK